MIKIIHIGPDSQFVQFAGGVFESIAPGCNEYIIFSTDSKLKNPLKHGHTKILHPGKLSLLQLSLMLRRADAIIAHGLNIYSAVAFLSAPRRAMKIWSGWGFDYYGVGATSEEELLGEQTLALVREIKSTGKKKSASKKVFSFLASYLRNLAISRTDLFSAPIPDDYKKMTQSFPKFSGEYAQINYGDVESTFSAGANVTSGRNILVGNSSSMTNNHLEVFEILANIDISNRKVIVPLSYGDDVYRSAIIKIGYQMLGESFQPLVDFMPLQKYVEIVASCSVVIMNHRRQQALGNIGSALYHGSRVYLDQTNPVFSFLQKRNALVDSIQNLKENGLPETNLSDEDVHRNRDVLEGFWGVDTVRKNAEELINIVIKRKSSFI